MQGFTFIELGIDPAPIVFTLEIAQDKERLDQAAIFLQGIVNLMQKIARLCSKERPIHGFVLSRTPVFSPLTQPQSFLRERPLDAIFNKLTMPSLVLAPEQRRGDTWADADEAHPGSAACAEE